MKKKIFPLLIALILGVSFTYIGLQVGTLWLVKTAFQWSHMLGWQPIQADVLSVDIKKTSIEPGSGLLFRVEAGYSYRINSQYFSGNQVGYNIKQYDKFPDDWHSKQYDRLTAAQQNGKTITVWFNPSQPQESIIDPTPRWADIKYRLQSLPFLFIGIASLWFAWSIFRTEDMDVFNGDKYEHVSGKLWWHEIWKESGITASTTKGYIVFQILIAAFLTSITIPLSIWLLYSQNTDWFILLFCSILFLFTASAIWQAIIETISWSRYGQLTLRMQPFPAILGDNFHANIGLHSQNFIGKTYLVSIVCNYVDSRGEGETTKLLWKKDLTLDSIETGNTARIEFDINLPVDLHETTPPTNIRYEWRILLRCNNSRAGLSTDFLIPVFQKT